MMFEPLEPLMSWMGPMGPAWSIVLLAVLTLVTGALVLVTHSRRSFDAPRATG
jgi:hypothetical protein